MFENAKWIRFKTDTVNIKNKYNPVPYIAKSFTVKSGLKSAMLHICTASEAAYFLNGTAILNSYRPSVPSTPHSAMVYRDFDLTSNIKQGKNRIGVMLSGLRLHYELAERGPSFILQLDLAYINGEKEQLVSGSSFKCALSSVIFSAHECGEIYNANLRTKNWCRPDFNDSNWQNAEELPDLNCRFRPTNCPAIRKIKQTDCVEIAPNLFDFKTTTSGYVKVTVSGKKGDVLKLNYSEGLTNDRLHCDMTTYLKEKSSARDVQLR